MESDLLKLESGSVYEFVNQYNKTLQQLADHHAPVQHRLVTIRPEADWYTEEIREAKQEKRKLEKHWRVSGFIINKFG